MSTHGRPQHNRALQALLGVHLLRVTKAAIASGSTNAKVSAALTILQRDDTVLTASMLEGRETLARTTGKVRGLVRLVEAFKTATSDDRAALGRVIGPAARFPTPRSCPPFEQRQPDPPHSSGTGRAGSSPETCRQDEEYSTMDMKKYAASRFIGVEDLRDGPRQETVVSVEPGKYDKPVATFESGDQLTLNKTNVRTLMSAYGEDSQDSVGCIIELFIGPAKYNGDQIESVVVKPISPPKLLKTQTPTPKKPNPDDDIPF